MHGGYEWNSVLLAYTMIDYLTEHPELIPASMRITIIPDLNPDGTFAVTGTEGRFNLNDVHTTNTPGGGRFNANRVDLNRNFDCKWQATSTWRGQSVNAGTGAFSEKEAAALRDYVITNKPVGVIFWHSQANAVYASECLAGILPGTRTLMTIYATAANYHAIESFDAYPVTGDAEGWLASIGIPAITVELSSHTSLDWEKTERG
jgi:predicted deacylase